MTAGPLTAGLGTGRVMAPAGRRSRRRQAASRALAFLLQVPSVLFFLVLSIPVFPVRVILVAGG
jgi:hypothetical protein